MNKAPAKASQAPATISNEVHPFAEKLNYLASLHEQDNSALIDLNGAKFITLEPSKTYVFLAVGTERVNSEFSKDPDGMTDAAQLIDELGNRWLCGQAVLVSTIKKFTPEQLSEGVALKVVCGEKVKGANGSYLAMQILRG